MEKRKLSELFEGQGSVKFGNILNYFCNDDPEQGELLAVPVLSFVIHACKHGTFSALVE